MKRLPQRFQPVAQPFWQATASLPPVATAATAATVATVAAAAIVAKRAREGIVVAGFQPVLIIVSKKIKSRRFVSTMKHGFQKMIPLFSKKNKQSLFFKKRIMVAKKRIMVAKKRIAKNKSISLSATVATLK